jgi:hypothetical protein
MTEHNKLPRSALVTLLAIKQGDTLRTSEDVVRLQAQQGRHDPAIRNWSPGDQRFAELMEAGDELWTFASPEITWEELAGRAGYAIVRNGDPIRYWMTVIN